MKKNYLLPIILMGAMCFYACNKDDAIQEEEQYHAEKQYQAEEEAIDGMLKSAQSHDFVREGLLPLPFFARMGAGAPKGIVKSNDGKYGMVFFYVNDPVEEIPPDFNLMNFFVFGIENWFLADYSVDGYSWFLPDNMDVPYMYLAIGQGKVPFWIIEGDQVDEVYDDDGIITLSELQNLEPAPMIGYADRFVEFMKPIGGGASEFGLRCCAMGKMDDGRRFFVKYSTSLEAGSPGPIEFDLEIYFYKSWW
jgi:hypothetical protein